MVRSVVRNRVELPAENLALRQQLAVLRERTSRPTLRQCDRTFWTILSRIWSNWRSALLIVQPETVIRCIAGASRSSGDGGRARNEVAHRSNLRSQNSSERCHARTHSGERHGFSPNSRCSGSHSRALEPIHQKSTGNELVVCA